MIKTRFAPSPTGYLHVGGLRTALYAYLFAKKEGGQFVLRIEDTDQKRLVEGAAQNLQDILNFFDLPWTEGPYFQSERKDLYLKHAEQLIESGHAYRCYCSSERLTEMRTAQQKAKLPPKYDRKCYNLSDKEKEELFNQGKNHVVRLLIPDEEVTFNDLVRGDVSFKGKDLDDQVLMKSDGFPTYHLAVVVDDHDMGITHVIRGEEWVPSTPKHIWLYEAFGWERPIYAHLPLLLNPDKSKLSKRQGDVAAEDFIKKGYLKEALINFIAFLGWNPGSEEEFFTLPELVNAFSLDRVQKAGAVFNIEKLDWMNGHYIRKMHASELGVKLLPLLKKSDWFNGTKYVALTPEQIMEDSSSEANDYIKYVACIQTRMKTLNEAPDKLRPFLLDELDYGDLFFHEKMKVDRAMSVMALENLIPTMEAHEDYSDEDVLKAMCVTVIQKLGVKNGQVLWPARVALTNEQYSAGAFELMRIMGKETSIKRMKEALRYLQS
ncbi:MAG: glutamyl-tRNA synthetase [Oceanicoccus sp.]|jgi:glutamyl-tRNA synthetase